MNQWDSPCKVNLLLSILGKRPDGFHELETILHPVSLHDTLTFEPIATPRVELTCNDPALSTDATNLVRRAADSYLAQAGINQGVRIHLEKRVPLAAGLGGGSSNAATTLRALDQLFGQPLPPEQLQRLAAALGSDVPFFLQGRPALATGRGELVSPLDWFPALEGAFVVLIHPGFGVSTAWAYRALAEFPEALHGKKGRTQSLLQALQGNDLNAVGALLYNSLETPVLRKYPLLGLYQDFLRKAGTPATLMSGSGSTTFAVSPNEAAARTVADCFRAYFGPSAWMAVVPL